MLMQLAGHLLILHLLSDGTPVVALGANAAGGAGHLLILHLLSDGARVVALGANAAGGAPAYIALTFRRYTGCRTWC